MNATLLNLVLVKTVLHSPMIACSNVNRHFNNFRLSKITDKFLFAVNSNVRIADSSFSMFLSRPITVMGEDSYTEKAFTSQKTKHGKKDVFFTRCTFINCRENKERGGGLWTHECRAMITHCKFEGNSAKFSGNAEITDAERIELNETQFLSGTAERFGGAHIDGHEPSNTANLLNTNFTGNRASKWIGGLRIQHNGGFIRFCYFEQNQGETYGAIWDYGHKPSLRLFDHIHVLNNTANYGAGITGFHLLYQARAQNCVFCGNRNKDGSGGRSLYLQADNAQIDVVECLFEGTRDEELAKYHPASHLVLVETNFSSVK